VLRRALIALALLGPAAVQPVPADESGVDQDRLAAAKARAQLHWRSGGYDDLPPAFDEGEVARQKETSIVARIADALLQANPAKPDAVLNYINRHVVPFIVAHKAQFECFLSEDYYNMSGIPTDQLADFGESPLKRSFDTAYLLLNTQAARWAAKVALPDNDTWQSALAFVREHGWTRPSNKIHFDCAA
jgi:hypothetical protein